MSQAAAGEIIRGTVDRVTFRNPSTGYSVLQVALDDGGDRITAVGICPGIKVGSHVVMSGSFVAHPTYGRQFTVSSSSDTPPSTSPGIQRYLSSGVITGIGKKTAQRIVDEFGTSALEIIRTDPDRVAALSGVGKKRAEILHSAILEQTEFDQILRFLVEHQISPKLAGKIYNRFRGKTIDTVKADPYVLAREVHGIGFKTSDSIALRLGIAYDSPLRLRAGLYAALDAAANDGHCYLTRAALLDRAKLLLGLEDCSELPTHIDQLIAAETFSTLGEGVFLKHLALAESAAAEFVAGRVTPKRSEQDTAAILAGAIADAEGILGVTLSAEQRFAVELASRYSLLIITGGPGCGKTTMVKALTLLFEKGGLNFALAAPTGKAAQRLSQVCGAPASTIHRLLKYDPLSNGFIFNARNQLPLDALIVDEASMIDILLARNLFEALPEKCTLILVGDKDQLPSVGPGRLFADLIRCPDVKTIQLSQLFRRSSESSITTVAHMINVGEVPHIPAPDGVTKSDAYMLERTDVDESARLIESLVAEQIPRKFGLSGSDVAVLTPTNRGPLGTIELNRRLQERLNPSARHTAETSLDSGENSFRVGDRVCQRVNNYKIDPAGVYNGDLGVITEVNANEGKLTVELWDGRLVNYSRGEVSQLSLAYAVTVHRSQGMEVPCVVLALDDSHFTLLERQLVYTGITRAKKLLIIVGSKRALAIAARKIQTRKRGTMLVERIELQLRPRQVQFIPYDE